MTEQNQNTNRKLNDKNSNSDPTRFANRKVAVITGAGRGIGKALVEVLREKNYVIFAVVLNATSAQEYNALNDDALAAIQCDVTDPGCEATLREFLSDRTDHVDLLINNAGFGASGYGIENLKFDELDRVLAVHCYGPIRCVRGCLPFLRKSSAASMMNVSSRFGSVEWVATGTVPHDQATYAYGSLIKTDSLFAMCFPASGAPSAPAAVCQNGVMDYALHPMEPLAVRLTLAKTF